MREKVTARKYVEALKNAGILIETNVPDLVLDTEIDCLTYDTRKLFGKAIFIVKGAHFKDEYLKAAMTDEGNVWVTNSAFEGRTQYVED